MYRSLTVMRVFGMDVSWTVTAAIICVGLEQHGHTGRKGMRPSVKCVAHCVGTGAFNNSPIRGRLPPRPSAIGTYLSVSSTRRCNMSQQYTQAPPSQQSSEWSYLPVIQPFSSVASLGSSSACVFSVSISTRRCVLASCAFKSAISFIKAVVISCSILDMRPTAPHPPPTYSIFSW